MAYGSGIDIYVLKTASWCNLNCSYCYYFNGADDSFAGRPKSIQLPVVERFAEEVVSHCREHGLTSVIIDFHGGEPLLQPKEEFRQMMDILRKIREAGIRPRYKVTTNAVLIDDEWIDLFLEHDVLVGISLDGPKAVHDMYRVDHGGAGSYDRVIKGLKKVQAAQARGLKYGVISVINPAIPGRTFYEHVRSLGVERLNLLMPEATYDRPALATESAGEAPFGAFLAEVFDAWTAEDNTRVSITILEHMIQAVSGLDPQTDLFGTGPVRVAIVETDGDIEPTDNFKICENRMTDLGINLMAGGTFNDLYYDEFFKICRHEALQLPQECQSCPFRAACNGGRLSNRYSSEHGFSQRTVYCADMKKALGHIRSTLLDLELV